MVLSLTPAPLVPSLPDVACKRTRHAITDLRDGDLLHVLADIAGPDGKPLFRKGTIVPVLGFVRCDDLTGLAYVVRAYVPGFGTSLACRDARMFPTALQQEMLFSYPETITEVDLTDHADALALERHVGARVIPMYPTPAHVARRAA